MSSNDNSAQKKAGSVGAGRSFEAVVQPVPNLERVGTRHVDEQLSMDR